MQGKTTIIAAASCAALFGGVSTAAIAQIGQPLIQQSPVASANPIIFPKLEMVNGVNRVGACESARFGSYDLYRKGIDTTLEIVSGDTGLVLAGPDMDKATSVRFRRDNGAIVPGTIERRIARGAVCGPDVANMSALVVRFNIADSAAVMRGTIEVFGKKERRIQVDPKKIPQQMCDFGEIGILPCPQVQPTVVSALDLKVIPRPVTTTINPNTTQTTNGDRHVRVVILDGQFNLAKPVLGDGFRAVESPGGPTQIRVLIDIFLRPNTTKRVEPRVGVELRRGGQVRLVDIWDTANAGGDAASRRFNKLGYDVRHSGETPPPPPPPPTPTPSPAANLDPFDPGNTLYKTAGGTSMDSAGNIYSVLTSQDHCQGIPLPGGTSSNILANRREITVPDIRFGVKNRGGVAVPAGAVVQLKFNGAVVATHTFNQPIAAGATVIVPTAYRRPDSTNTVAVLTGGGVCYHAGLSNEGWTDNDGYTIVLPVGNEVELID